MADLYIINHGYHYEYVKNKIGSHDAVGVVGSVDVEKRIFRVPHFESSSILQKILIRFVMIKLHFLIVKYDRVIFLGCQDWVSYKLYKKIKENKVFYVADNIEFYLRPNLGVKLDVERKSDFRFLLKLFLYGLFVEYYRGEVSYVLNRFVFPLNKSRPILHNMVLDGEKLELPVDVESKSRRVFISQPYYIDYGIDLYAWCEQVRSVVHSLGIHFVKIHPRDSVKYLHVLESMGIRCFEAKLSSKDIIFGVFSTLMLQAAFSKTTVFSVFADFEYLLPDEYVTVVRQLSAIFDVGLTSENFWNPNSLNWLESK
ncbi:hypothetical protein BGP77_03180 [Saccharospirillum sp. MSK14-1]|uniref:hypothetical protein n=1 Tax=Saccharospirillum sp. MSK14-1 TaxID=1897632 RepID=UPI000D3C3219|nr:hypothetical protein [Saccharospirillum sp. MSK14-1]PTY36325.1 hypothetical protein BGP77_03180 [Saccharospirillum sp. MSK14-1]